MDRIVRRKQLLELIGVSSATQWRLEKAGEFPARIKIGKASVGWHLTEVEVWLRDRERVTEHGDEGKRLRRSSDKGSEQQLSADTSQRFSSGENLT